MAERRMSPLGWLGIALVVAIALMAIFGVLSLTTDGGYFGTMEGGVGGWGLVLMAVPGAILVAVLLAVLGALGDGSALARTTDGTPRLGPLDVLDLRYAEGRLDRDEYLRIRAELTKRPSRFEAEHG